ncbi:MAG: RNA-binding cell elongation regulator Jag/EloR [Bacillota bacterium]
MVQLEKTGKTVDEALAEAAKELHLEPESIPYEVVEEGGKGFLGFLNARHYKVRVEMTESKLAEKRGLSLITRILEEVRITAAVDTSVEENLVRMNIKGKTLGLIIGRRGQVLDALQYLVNLAANRGLEQKVRILVDVEGYRAKREEILTKLALRLADKVRRNHRKTVLEPMPPHERRIIHCTLQNAKGIFTYSEGEDPYRRVIISPENE